MTDFSDLPVPATSRPSIAASNQGKVQAEPAFSATFWGVRGNRPVPGAHTIRYGGNTACVEVQVAGKTLIFDGGTGLVVLGHQLGQRGQAIDAHLFFTHSHWDRIQGFPFFRPAFDPSSRLHIYGGAALNGASIKQQLMNQMLRPNFSTPLQAMKADMTFHNIQPGSTISLGEVAVEIMSLNPHTSALGFRVAWADRALVYATDTDHTQATADPNLVFLAAGADVMIFDGTYADTAYADPLANRMIPFELGIQVAQAAQVGQLVLFHHNPCHADDQLDQLEREVRSHFPHACLAQEGMTLQLA